jgi:hypothetical protein
MANFNNRQTKIRIQCERAQKEDVERERMAAEGFTNHEIEDYIQNKRMQPFRKPLTVHPMDENRHVVNPVDLTSTGLPGTHLVKSAAKDFNTRAQKKYDKYQDQKKTTRQQEELARTKQVQFKENLEQGLAPPQETTLRPSTNELEREARKTKTKTIEKAFNHLIKTQNYRDHMREMEQGMDELNKMPKNSHYAEEFGFDKNMQELTDNTNFDHHMRANDLKWYNEAYVKYKSTMRK